MKNTEHVYWKEATNELYYGWIRGKDEHEHVAFEFNTKWFQLKIRLGAIVLRQTHSKEELEECLKTLKTDVEGLCEQIYTHGDYEQYKNEHEVKMVLTR